MPPSGRLVLFAIAFDLHDFTGRLRQLQPFGVESEQHPGECLQRLQFRARDVRLVALRKSLHEEAVPADPEQNDGTKPARFAAAFTRDALLEHTPPRSASHRPAATASAAAVRELSRKRAFRANRENSFVL
jgi:hypothetical protein